MSLYAACGPVHRTLVALWLPGLADAIPVVIGFFLLRLYFFVFTANTHYRLATAWRPFRRVAAREMGGKNAWTTRNDGYPSCVYSITPFSLLFLI